ncbi:UTP--glucose-1-phosphate uridylyltransferase GalU [Oceanobacter kriegii]|uniref:UTP--glucose-1-phosphate uridylyltransferase GalU n=1 Tax=Oceanobacter kriegii TaxID=64972 RepID=UPI00042A2475|nr:UTP--glucose-1-phosphate uridylyltransferase GalU [Oceanobacter kriegii]
MVRKCLFPVAGYGTRFLPATKAMPKEMLPVVNKPLVQYGVEEASEAGMKFMGFITGRGKRAIADHFDISYELENEIRGSSKEGLILPIRKLMEENDFAYTRQNEMKGLGHAVQCGQYLMGDEPFGMILADDLCVADEGDIGVMAQMAQIHEKYGCSVVAVQEVPEDNIHKYGVIAGEEIEPGVFRVNNMVEKPAKEDAPSNLAIIGRYILTPDIFAKIEETGAGINGEIQITDALLKQAQEGNVIAYKFRGRRFDCGSIEGFVEATNYVYENIFKKA